MISKEEQEYRVALGMSLKKYREMMGLTLTDVTNQTGINKGMISHIEKGKRPIRPEVIEKLAELYRTRVSFIHQGAADRLETLGLVDPNIFIKMKMDLDGSSVIITSKSSGKSKKYRIPESLLSQINKDFHL